MSEGIKITNTKSGIINGVRTERIVFSDGKTIYWRSDKNTYLPKDVPEKYLILAREHMQRRSSEDEVARIMKERGYNSENYKKKTNRRKRCDSIIQTIKAPILALLGITVIIGSVFVFFVCVSDSKIQKRNSDFEDNISSVSSQEYKDYLSCINKIDSSNISYDDEKFWDKHAKRYEEKLSCYKQFPNVISASEKRSLEKTISEFKEKASSQEKNNIEYRKKMAEIDRDLQKKLAEYDREKEQYDRELDEWFAEYDKKESERKAQDEKETAERNAKNARCADFREQYPDVDTYKKEKGNLDELYNSYQSAQSAYNSAYDSYSNWMSKYGTKHSAEYLTRQSDLLAEKRAKMESARSAWSSANISLGDAYNDEYRQACL